MQSKLKTPLIQHSTRLSRRAFLTWLLALGTSFAWATDATPKLVHYQIKDKRIKQAVRLCMISDLHSCDYGKNQRAIMDLVRTIDAHAVCLVGDIYDDQLPFLHADICLDNLRTLGVPLLYVNGNHELYLPEKSYQKVLIRLQDFGAQILHGQGVDIQGVPIFGVSDPVGGNFDNELAVIGMQAQTHDFNVLLAHRPERIHAYLKYNFALTLSGHAHGGQWRLPPFVNGVWAPNQGFLPKYAGGAYTFDDDNLTKTLIVGRGLAKESTRLIPRIFNRPEVLAITLLPA